MPTKRTPIHRGRLAPISDPGFRAKIERLVELYEAHEAALHNDSASFYNDGRHEEMMNLLTQVHSPLGIKPWDQDPKALLIAALHGGGVNRD